MSYWKKHYADDAERDAARIAESARNAAWAKRNPEKVRARSWRCSEKKRLKLAGRPRPKLCEVCDKAPGRDSLGRNRMHPDHNHITGAFRGWICADCNRAIGLMKDDPGRLRKAAAYLETDGTNNPVAINT